MCIYNKERNEAPVEIHMKGGDLSEEFMNS